MPQMIWRAVYKGSWTWSSPQWLRYTGQNPEESSDAGWLEAIHPEDQECARASWARASTAGEFRAELRVRGQDGRYRWFKTQGRPIRDKAGTIVEWIGTSTDIEDLRRLQSEQKVLVAELQHRTRNLIAVVHSICMQTLRGATSLEDFGDRFEDRLSALSRVQGLLSNSENTPITIGHLIDLELQALAGGLIAAQVQVSGPNIVVRATTAQTLALAVHELSTNALKHGALSLRSGRLKIVWREDMRDGVPWLCLLWRETGAQALPKKGKRGGFGQVLIEQALPLELGAETEFSCYDDGIQCAIDLPLQQFRSEDLNG